MLISNNLEELEIPVVIAADDNYAQHLGVAINSIIKNKLVEDRLKFYIFDCGISETNRLKLLEVIEKQLAVTLSFIPIDIKMFSDFVITGTMSKATYARYMIPSLVKEDKIIYLDCDLIVRSSLRGLYQEDVKEYYFAGCADFKLDVRLERLGLQKYCNTGVMLINVRRWREDDIQEKLIKYTEKYPGKLLFNNQDVLNIVLQDSIKYLDKRWNALASQYAISEFSRLAETAFIIHFASPASEKPWMPGTKSPMKWEYFKYLRHTPWQPQKLIVSVTSYPARISGTVWMLETFLKQTLQPDEIILWLGLERFPNRLSDLPERLQEFVESGKVTIGWCRDIGPHTKYFYAFKAYPDALVITVDDDVYYPENLVENLYQSYLQFPDAVSAMQVKLVGLTESGTFIPWVDGWPTINWSSDIEAESLKPSMHFLAEGICGVLYPTGLFSKAWDFLDIPVIQRTCPNNDDLWLKAMQLAADVPVVVAAGFLELSWVPGSQVTRLNAYNKAGGGTDYEWGLIQKAFDRRYGEGAFIRKISEPSVWEDFLCRRAMFRLQEELEVDLRKRLVKANRSLAAYRTFRVNIRNNGAESNIVKCKSIDPAPSRMFGSAAIPNGVAIESAAGRMKVIISAVGDGELDVRLISRNVRNPAGQRYPVWVDVSYFAVNGEVVFDEVKTVCFDRRYQYTRPVKDGETVMLEFAWNECQSSTVLDELRRLQADLKETRQKLKKTVQENARLKQEKQQLMQSVTLSAG